MKKHLILSAILFACLSASAQRHPDWLKSDTSQSYPMVYSRSQGEEQYIIAVSPSGKSVTASISTQKNKRINYVFGTSAKCGYKTEKTRDMIKLPAVSAAIFKVE